LTVWQKYKGKKFYVAAANHLQLHERFVSSQRDWFHEHWPKRNEIFQDWMALVTDSYWTRAWVTQEMLLARKLVFSTDVLVIDSNQLAESLSLRHQWSSQFGLNVDLKNEGVQFFAYLSALVTYSLEQDPQNRLINLLDKFRGRQSRDIRDQIYSLRFLAFDAGSVSVDYHTSNFALAGDVLHNCKGLLCICSIQLICDTLQYTEATRAPNDQIPTFLATVGYEAGKPFLGFEVESDRDEVFAIGGQLCGFTGDGLMGRPTRIRIEGFDAAGSFPKARLALVLERIGAHKTQKHHRRLGWVRCQRIAVSEYQYWYELHLDLDVLLSISKAFLRPFNGTETMLCWAAKGEIPC